MIGVVVLAAGEARRFGSPKLVAEWWGRPLIERALLLAPADCPKVVVIRHELEPLRALFAEHDFSIVRNPAPEKGLASSLKIGLDVLPAAVTAAMILPGDAPGIPEGAVTRLRTAYRKEGRAVCAVYDGERGHPVVLPRGDWSKLASSGDQAGAQLEMVEVDCSDLASASVDVDTQDELFALAARCAHAPLVQRLRNLESLDARLGLPDPFVLSSVDGPDVRTVQLGDEEDHVLVPVSVLESRALEFGRRILVIARVGDAYAALVG